MTGQAISRQALGLILTSLNWEDKQWAMNVLKNGVGDAVPAAKRKARKTSAEQFADEQWNEYFGDEPAIPLPEDAEITPELVAALAGKTIEPMKRWL